MQKQLCDKVRPPDFRPELVLMACFDGTSLLYLVIIVVVGVGGNALPGALTAAVSVANRNDWIRNVWCHFLSRVRSRMFQLRGSRSPAVEREGKSIEPIEIEIIK